MKNNFQSKSVPRGTRTIWRYLGALFLLFTFAVGNVWAEEVKLVSVGTTATQSSPDFFDNKTYKSSDESYSVNLSTNGTSKSQGGSYDSKKDYYYALGSACDMSGTPSNYFKVSATGCKISKIVVRMHDNSTSQACFPAMGCVDELPSTSTKSSKNGRVADVIIDNQTPSSYGSVKRFDNASTLTYTFSTNVSEVYLSKQIKKVGLASATAWSDYPSSSAQSVCVYGIDVYVVPETTADVAPEITAPTTDQSAVYTVGDAITALSVTATGTPTPTYQWYYNSSASTESATSLGSGAQTASYTPANDVVSDLYYYCIATNSKGSAQSPYFHVTVSAAVATAPSFTSPASEPAVAEYSVGDAISALEVVAAGYPAPTLQWYSNSSKSTEGATLITGAESASYTPSNAAVSDLYFYCVATNASGTAQSEYFHVTVAAVSYCAELYPATSGASPTGKNQELLLQTVAPNASYGGKIYTAGAKSDNWSASFTYGANGLSLNKGGADSARVELTHLMKVGTVITATLVNPDAEKARGYKLLNMAKTAKATWQATTTDPQVYTYTVVEGDGLAGTNMFLLQRAETSALKELKVSNCGAELFELSSAIDPVHDPAYATVTLSKSLVAAGGTATATYSAIDPAYDFDEWQISGTGATLSSTTANPTTITMGSTDAVVTLKLKEKAGFAVTYKANNGTEEADVVVSKENTFAANTFTAPEGKMFAGWNTQADGKGTNYAVGAAVEAATTVYAKWVVDPTIRLIKNDGTLNTVNFVTGGTLKDDGPFTVEAVEYAKNVQFGNSCSGVSSIDNLNKAVIYHSTTSATKVTIVAYNNYTGGSTANLLYAVVPEGTTTASAITKTLNKSTGGVYEVNMTGRSTLYIYAGHKEVRICQVSVEENGTANAVAPAVGYSVNLNKQRPFLTSGAVTEFEGIEYKVSSNYKPLNGQVQIQTLETNYISFEIPEGETRQLQLTTSNTNKYTVSKTLGDNTESKKVSGNQNINLTEGVWYINPQGSNVNITTIAFAAAPDALTVTFKDGTSTLGTQNVWSGEKATALSPAPTKDGYRFVKWQKEGVDYDFDAAVTTDITLDAVWQQVVTVTFAPANGEENFTKTADKGATLAAGDRPADPEYAGHVFQGWTRNTSAEPVVYVDLATETFDANATLTAVWEVAQTDATISALSYNGNAIDVESAKDVAGVATYTVHLQWGTAIDKDLISVTKTASSATVGTIAYDSEAKKATFTVTAGDGTTTAAYAIQFVIDAKRGTSIIKATTNNVVTGLIGGTIDQSYSGNANSRKQNKGNYFGVTLANDETFQEGDVFIVNITTPADLGKFMIYADKNRTELVADQGIVYTKPEVADPVICPTGEMRLVLPAAATGKKSLYLSRENSDNSPQWNVTFSYVEVTREMNPAIKSFKFGDDAATINESAKTISIDVPYGTDVTALTPTVEAYGNNGATYTPAGATDFTSPVVYTVTDAYNELHTDYTVTVNIAAPSENANLASLAVAGYSLDFDPATTSYNVVLDYGTTVLPEITYAVEDAGLATAVKVEGGINGATTITVTPQAGESYKKVYTINFSVSTTPKFVIYDGSTMTNIASATGADGSTGFSYSLASNIPLSGDAISSSWGGKDYTHAIKGFKPNDNSSNIVSFVIPEGYVAKVRLVGSTNSDTKERKLFIAMSASKDAADALNNYIITSSTYDAQGFVTDYLLPNTYYLGSTDSYRLFEFSIQLYPIDEERAMTQGRFGTICYPNGGRLLGAMLLEIAYFDPDQKKIFFDEVIGGQMVAGAPYLFLPNEGVDKFAIVYTDNVGAPAGHHNGLYGSYTQEVLPTDGNHYIMLNNQYCKVVEANTYVGANRAYIQLDKIGNDYLAPAYGRRRVSLGVQQAEVATGLEDLNVGDQPIKIMINGQMYILRGEKMYDATGRLVK